MPILNGNLPHKNIAVIGAGISGLGAAHMLGSDHRVTVFEAEARLGGHARTIIAGASGNQPVDTGFIVFNYANYPHLAALFEELDVPVVPSSMSFGASIDGGRLEYGLASVFSRKAGMRLILASCECCAISTALMERAMISPPQIPIGRLEHSSKTSVSVDISVTTISPLCLARFGRRQRIELWISPLTR
jgi:uncharacterized protein with NAD-binding domain and iron-sulfur cluster